MFTATLISEEGTQHSLEDTLNIGREDDNAIVLKNDRVSRHHARLTLADSTVTLEDLNSSNGTRCNGQPVTTPTTLKNGDRVEVGPFGFTLNIAGEDSPESSQSDGGATVFDQAPTPDVKSGDSAKPGTEPARETAALPGSWVEEENQQSTQFFTKASAPQAAPVQRHGELPQLLLLDPNGSVQSIFELETDSNTEKDVWEIGRLEECDVCLSDPTVSTRHAQLIHSAGRWRMVNLVSSNGIIVNGEKRLAVYLSDGDIVQLGGSQLAFFGDGRATGSSSKGGGKRKKNGSDKAEKASGKNTLWIVLGVALLIAVGIGVAIFSQI